MYKKILLALTGVAIAGPSIAADLPASTYARTPAAPPIVAPNWTGFYLFGGGGGGLWSADTSITSTATGACLLCGTDQRQGGYGSLGTVGAGFDWQFNERWLVGAFADGQFGSLKGTIQDQALLVSGSEKMQAAWAAGIRVGRVIAPNVMTYFNVGYSGSKWSGTTLYNTATGGPSGLHTDGFEAHGYFFGGGIQHNLEFFGLTAPGWFMKTEYRTAYYENKKLSELVDGTNALTGRDINFKPRTQTIMSTVTYRFNWTPAPGSARY